MSAVESLGLPNLDSGPAIASSSPNTPPCTTNPSSDHSTNTLSPLTTTTPPPISSLAAEKRTATDESSHSPKKKKKKTGDGHDVVWIGNIVEAVETGTIVYNRDRCLPATVQGTPFVRKHAKIWNFYRSLKHPITEKVIPAKRVLGIMAHGVTKTKTYIHLCLECLKEIKELGENAESESWMRALCRITNTSNGKHHLKSKYMLSSAVITYFAEKDASSVSSGALHSGGKM